MKEAIFFRCFYYGVETVLGRAGQGEGEGGGGGELQGVVREKT